MAWATAFAQPFSFRSSAFVQYVLLTVIAIDTAIGGAA